MWVLCVRVFCAHRPRRQALALVETSLNVAAQLLARPLAPLLDALDRVGEDTECLVVSDLCPGHAWPRWLPLGVQLALAVRVDAERALPALAVQLGKMQE